MRISQKQQGAAILLALVIMVTIAGLAAAAVSQHWSQQRGDTIARTNLQHKALTSAVLQWAHAILMEDRKMGTTDDLQEIWAQPLPETSIAEFLGKGNAEDTTKNATIEGRIEDLESKWNIWDLFQEETDKGAHAANMAVLERIGAGVGLSPGQFNNAIEQSRARFTSLGFYPLNPNACWQWLGLQPEEIVRIQPYLTCIPSANTININTASHQLLAWILSPELAAQIVAERKKRTFDDVTDIGKRIVPRSNQSFFTLMPYTGWTVRSNWFTVRLLVTMGGVTWPVEQTLQRLSNRIVPLSGGVVPLSGGVVPSYEKNIH